MIETALPSSELAKKRKRLFLFSALATLIVASFLFFYWLLIWRFEEYTNDAYVSGNMVELTPQVAGIISSIRADDTDLVEESQVVIELDKTDLALAFEQRKAELGQSVRKVAQMFLTVEKLKAELLVKEAMRTKAQEDFQNRVDIVALGAVSKEEFEHVVAALDEAKASYDASKQSLDRAVAMIVNTRIPTHPLVEQAKEMIRRAWVDLNRTRILSPVNGYVAKRGGQLGEWAFPSKPLLAIVPLDQIWVNANFKEVQLSKMRIGQRAKVTSDLYGSKIDYHGVVVGIGAGTGSAFSALPPQNATGNWIKIVQRVPVRIVLDPQIVKKYPLRLGLSMRVTVDLHNTEGERLSLIPSIRPIYQTNIYHKQQEGIEEIIEQIIEENLQEGISL